MYELRTKSIDEVYYIDIEFSFEPVRGGLLEGVILTDIASGREIDMNLLQIEECDAIMKVVYETIEKEVEEQWDQMEEDYEDLILNVGGDDGWDSDDGKDQTTH